MTWYAASVIIGMRRVDNLGPMLGSENIFLIEAPSSKEALDKAREYGNTEASLDDEFTLDGQPAKRVFVGIRKLINISNPFPLKIDSDAPTSGTEITYSLFEVSNEQDLEKLAQGQDIVLRYIE
ncbi:MAG: DUF4288 domain-containing protein [Methylococcales bacterium]